MLLVREGRINLERVREAASLLQSTSPNQLLLASIDIARLQMAENGRETVARAVRLAEKLRRDINEIDGLWSFGPEYMNHDGASGLDTTKVTVQVTGIGLTGVEAEYILRHTYKIQCELSDARNLLFIISYADTEKQTAYLLKALQGLAREHRRPALPQKKMDDWQLPAVPTQGMAPREAFFAPKEDAAFAEAEGHIAAEQLMLYPPGIPILCPGDIIDRESLQYIKAMQELGLKVVGPRDASLQKLQVVRQR